MITALLYELKSKKKNWLIASLMIILAFTAAFIIMKLTPVIILTIVNFMNSSAITLELFGLDKQVTSVTYKDLAFSVITVANPIILYFVAKNVANSYWYDKRMGNTLYFLTQPVSKMSYWFSKTLVNLMYTLIVMLTLYAATFALSLNGVPVKELQRITIKHVNKSMLAMFVTIMLFYILGTILGSVVSEYKGLKIIKYLVIIMVTLCILPNAMSALVTWLSSVNEKFEVLAGIVPILEKIRAFVLMH